MGMDNAIKTAANVVDIATLSANLAASVTPVKQVVPTAPAEKSEATRANWTGSLVWGTLPAFPVKTFKATELEKFEFNRIHVSNRAEINAAIEANKTSKKAVPVPAPIYAQVKNGESVSALDAEQKVASADILKGFKYGEGQYVVVTDEDKQSCMVASDKLMTIESFVPASEIDPIFFQSTEYLIADATSDIYNTLFSLLRATMIDRKVFAIAKCNQRGREETLVIRPYGEIGVVISYLYFDNEVRSFNKWVSAPVTSEQIASAGQLVDAMTKTFDPTKFMDNMTRRVKGMLNAKIAGAIVAPATIAPIAAPVAKKANVMDLLTAAFSAFKAS